MNAYPPDERIAEYLGGELTGSDLDAFEQALKTQPELRREIEELKATLHNLRSLNTEKRTVPLGSAAVVPPRSGLRRIALFAASLIVAFSAGFFTHKGWMQENQEPGSGPVEATAARVLANSDSHSVDASLQNAFAAAYAQRPAAPNLGRSWIALSRALQE